MPKEINFIEENFYAVQTEEDKEFYVKNSISNMFKDFTVFIPIDKSKKTIKGVKLDCYNKSMPEYVIIACNNIDCRQAEAINRLPGVVKLLSDITSTGVSPSAFRIEEVKKITNSFKKQEDISSLLNSNVTIINGYYSGLSATVKKVSDDNLSVVINTKNKPKVKISIWDVGKEVI